MQLLEGIDFALKTQKRECYKNVIYLTPRDKKPKLSKKIGFRKDESRI